MHSVLAALPNGQFVSSRFPYIVVSYDIDGAWISASEHRTFSGVRRRLKKSASAAVKAYERWGAQWHPLTIIK